MRIRIALVLMSAAVVVLAGAGGVSAPTTAAAADARADVKTDPSFKNDVLPVLKDNCTRCHGEGGKKAKAGVNLTNFTAVSRAVKAGDPDKSRLYKSLLGKGAKQMPPKSSLPDESVELVKAWIAAGAKDN
jgi:cytochrome c5